MTGEEIIKRYTALDGANSNWKALWQEIGDYLLPRRSDANKTVTAGTKTTSQIKSSTPGKCLTTLGSVLNSSLTNIDSEWFVIRLSNKALNELQEVKLWLDDVTDITRQAFYDSNFALAVYEFFIDLAALGTGAMYLEEGLSNLLQFTTFPVTSSPIAESPEGVVDTIFRPFKFTARQAEMKWGRDKLPEKVRKSLENGKDDDEYTFIHAVFPRTVRDENSPFARDMPYASYYVELQSKQVVSEGGYFEFPFSITRWSKMSGEVYGRGPGDDALPDIKQLYEIKKTLSKAGKKAVDPPLDVPVGAYDHEIRSGANQINWRNANKDPIQALELVGNLPWGKEEEEALKNDIRDTFFVTQLQMIDKTQMTLGEVQQRTRENLRILGPTFGRLVYEFLNLIIKRSFGIMQRAGMYPPPPEVLQGQKISVQYQSPLSLVQQDQDIQAIAGSMELIAPMAQMFPEILDNVDGDEAARLIMKRKGVPASVIRDDKVINEIRATRAQAQQEELDMQAMERGSSVRRNLAALPGGRMAANG